MATGKTTGNSEFLEFLKGAPTLDEATSQETTELTGVVSRTEDGKFAITTAHGQTYEMDAAAVQQFRAVEGHGFSKIATIQITNEALKAAVLRQIKPVFKDMIKDPIKEVGTYPVAIHLHADVKVQITVVVEAEGGTDEEGAAPAEGAAAPAADDAAGKTAKPESAPAAES